MKEDACPEEAPGAGLGFMSPPSMGVHRFGDSYRERVGKNDAPLFYSPRGLPYCCLYHKLLPLYKLA